MRSEAIGSIELGALIMEGETDARANGEQDWHTVKTTVEIHYEYGSITESQVVYSSAGSGIPFV